MCGICGYIDSNGACDTDDVIKKMTGVLRHRGPDDEGYYVNRKKGVCLGMRRLSIIDLHSGRQPIYNEDGTIVVVYNGEIYNYRELREALGNKGHVFTTKSDTEVIVHLYEQYGKDFVHHLNGMFAIALFDSRNDVLLLVRDRMGVKPLFYYAGDGRVVFASEIKGILQFPVIERDVDPGSLMDYLCLYYVVAPRTLFKGIHQLLPGEMISFNTQSRSPEKKKYWDISINIDHSLCEKEVLDYTEYLITDAIGKRLISDVPLGAFLSGGIDSSTIVAIMAGTFHLENLKTFTVTFDESSHNELRWAREVSELYNTENVEVHLNSDALQSLPHLVWSSEEPTGDASALNVYHMSLAAREHVKVVLTGDGADEIFCGYDTYAAQPYLRLLQAVPQPFREILGRAVEMLPERTKKMSPEMLLKRFFRAANSSREAAHFSWRMSFYEHERKKIVSNDFLRSNGLDGYDTFLKCKKHFDTVASQDFLNQMLYVDSTFYLPNDMLVKVDRATMAASLEARTPFLDFRLVEYLFKVPTNIKYRKRIKKYLLKKIMQGRIPNSILNRRKQGFNVPLAHWFRNEKAGSIKDILMTLGRDMTFLEMNYISKIMDEHTSGRRDHGYKLWTLLVLMIWHHTFITGRDIAHPLDIVI